MELTYLLALVIAVFIVIASVVVIRTRMAQDAAEATPPESPFATSTEGMKVCPRCGMGNLWTDRKCISCGAALKG